MGFGSADGMKRSLAANKKLLGKRKSLKELSKESGNVESNLGELKFKEPTAKELAAFNQRLAKQLSTNRHKRILAITIVLTLGILMIYLLFRVPV